MRHLNQNELEAGLDEVRRAPADQGTLRMIVRRPGVDRREVFETGELSLADGLVGDSWRTRSDPRLESPDPDRQINIINARAIDLFAGSPDRWSLAGDQLYLDFDLSDENLPPGTRLALGEAEIEITDQPHTGCAKFRERFGIDVLRLVNSPHGRALNLRGVCARVIRPGTVRQGDLVKKVGSIATVAG
ncbi:MAG: MOSC domain-containing protein [Gemmatimonas sp.]|nr:MOSC domain-containing protein [Gemmatimonas sp.]